MCSGHRPLDGRCSFCGHSASQQNRLLSTVFPDADLNNGAGHIEPFGEKFDQGGIGSSVNGRRVQRDF